MTLDCSVRTIQDRWLDRAVRASLGFLLVACLAATPAPPPPIPYPELKAGIAACESKQYALGIEQLHAASRRVPGIIDYAAYELASCLYESQDLKSALAELDRVWYLRPLSPLAGKAALLAARIHSAGHQPRKATEVLRQHWDQLPQPEGYLKLAQSFEAAGDAVNAAMHYQKVYFQYPAAPEEKEAAAALERLRMQLGEAYPPAMPHAMLDRIAAMFQARDYMRARRDLESWIPQLGGAGRELARVRLGAAKYLAGDTGSACNHLRTLEVTSEDADAERLYYLAECARRLDKDRERAEILEQLGRTHPRSPWRLKALVSAGNHHLVLNEPLRYEPLYRACCETFPADPQAAYCHWKLAWSAYLGRRSEAADMLREHLSRFPASEKASAALYFLGRLSEAGNDIASAKACYTKLQATFVASYYKPLAEKRLTESSIRKAATSVQVTEFLNRLALAAPNHTPEFKPDAPTQARIDRARLLTAAGLPEWGESELRFGARTGARPLPLAMELARSATRRGAPQQGIRYIKGVAHDYLSIPLQDAPLEFWRLAFPLPYRTLVERYAAQSKLDPHILAGLIRQESEFDPKAVSPSKAYGLTQVLPSTGRELSRKLGMRRFRTAMLVRPDINLRLGTYYLRSILDQFDGRWEPALASYNGGLSRVTAWLEWAKFQEPAEFIETIPFTETRGYVQIVLRNAEVYRWLYGQKAAPAAPRRQPVRARKSRRR